MDDEQLLKFDEQQARQQLNDDQLERYNELKQEQLQGAIEEKKTEDNINASEGLANLREATETDLTVTVEGIKFLADVEPSQLNKLTDVAKFEQENSDRKISELSENELENVRSNLLDVLSDLSVNHSREDWQENFGDAGLITLATITGNLLDKVESYMNQKKSR